MIDIKAARELCERIKGYEDPDAGNWADFAAALMLPAALDRIEELEAIGKAKDFGMSGLANRVAELEAAITAQSIAFVEGNKRTADQIQKLKDALVEERARRICHNVKDNVGHWPRYEEIIVSEAREQLSREMPEIWEGKA